MTGIQLTYTLEFILKKIFSDKSSFTLVNMNKASKKVNNIIALQIPNQIAS